MSGVSRVKEFDNPGDYLADETLAGRIKACLSASGDNPRPARCASCMAKAPTAPARLALTRCGPRPDPLREQDAEAGTLLRRHTRGQRNRLLHGDHRVFGGGAERAVSLHGVTPHVLPDPL
jgi:hypothetical protein